MPIKTYNKHIFIKDQPLYVDTWAWYPYSDKLEKKYVFNSFFKKEDEEGNEVNDTINLHKVNGKFIGLPRGLCPTPLDTAKLKYTLGENVFFTNSIKPRGDDQREVMQEVNDLLIDNNFIICLGTGYGKTLVCLNGISSLSRTALIVVNTGIQETHFRNHIVKYLNIPEEEIGFISGDKCFYEGTKIAIGYVQSLSKPERYPKELYSYFGQIWFDECHNMGANLFSRCITNFYAKTKIGLSATPERKDGKHIVPFSHIGPIMVRRDTTPLVPKVKIIKSGWKVPRNYKFNPKTKKKELVQIPHKKGRTMHILKILANNQYRHDKLVKVINTIYNSGRNLIVFSQFKKDLHLNKIYNSLIHTIPKDDIGFLVASSDKNREEAEEEVKYKKIILATYKYAGEGLDIVWLDTVILSTPRSNIQQFIGRVLREYPNKKQPLVFEFVDDDSPVFADYYGQHLHYYKRIGAEVKEYV